MNRVFFLTITFVAITGITLTTLTTSRDAYAAPEWFEKLFPELFRQPANDPKPSQTLQAPFAAPGDSKPIDNAIAPYTPGSEAQNDLGLDQPHRSVEFMGKWVTDSVSHLLTFAAPEYDDHLVSAGKLMSPQAIEYFKTFVTSSQMIPYMQQNNLVARAFAEDAPRQLNQGVIQGRLRWLYEIPVTLTFMPARASYEENPNPVNQRLIVNLQVGRVQGAAEGMLIESWDVKGAAPDKKK